ncbi:MAG: 5-carboxymethyl-2-hydroxymuconate isomerase [Deltaproteobacteria bacterium]|jgi:2-keto-4-pentenoate hydratase/2-oxohepta-3-ene-1,7-dioic acid hydratase in catechol pathway|nr:5-carboxymethyl-2-hydroxymuconate isomerase [Deltaproteobacteria bacterium]
MKLVTFSHDGSTRIGVAEGDEVVDLAASAPELPTEMVAFLRAGESALEAARAAVAAGGARLPRVQVHLESPILRPPKILAIGVNYGDHIEEAKEGGMKIPEYPVLFNKQSTSAHPPFDPFHLPRASSALDYEGELAVVIGKPCRHVPRDRAHEVIAGYTVANDVTVRDWQLRTPTFTIGKSFDTHCPMGPWILTPDEFGDPHTHDLKTWVNGELRQSSNTKHLVFDCFHLIEHLSTAFTLEVGDVISTGTPGGVGIAMKPPSFLVEGDVVRVAIEGLGEIENSVVAEPGDTVRIG